MLPPSVTVAILQEKEKTFRKISFLIAASILVMSLEIYGKTFALATNSN